MKKMLTYLFTFMCLLSATLLSACDFIAGPDVNINFNEQYIELDIGDTIDLTQEIYYENVKLEDIQFSSLDPSIVLISNGQLSAVGSGSTIVRAEYMEESAIMEVKVVQKPSDVSAPTGLMYDLKNQCVSWNHVLVKVGNNIQQVNSYTVSLTLNGKTKEYPVIGTNQYKITEGGNFTIKVKCNALEIDGQTVYNGSIYSSPIEVRQLSTPTNLQYNDETKTLTWDCESDVSQFQVKVNDVYFEPTTSKQFTLDLKTQDINLQKQQVYNISVISVKAVGQQSGDIVAQAESQTKKLTRLYAPTLNISKGIVSWDNSQQGDFHYEVIAVSKKGNSLKIPVTNNQFSISQLSTGEYSEITIKAVADSVDYLDSQNISKLTDIQKLAPATITFNPVNKTFYVSNHNDRNVELEITHKNNSERIKLTEKQNGSYIYNWDKTEVGDYTVIAYICAEEGNDKEINSEASTQITLTQLPQVDSQSVEQRVESNKYYLEHSQINQANLYEYTIKMNETETYVLKQKDGSLGDVGKLFSNIGTYTIEITASNTQNLGTTRFVLPSITEVTVIRQENVKDLNYKNNSVNWTSIATTNTYSYYVTKDGKSFVDNETTTSNLYSTLNLEYGEYKFYVKAKGWDNSGILYLDSLDYSEVDFDVNYTLNAPELNFDRETKKIIFDNVENAQDYVLELNDTLTLSYYEEDGRNVVDLASRLNEAGDYVVSIKAINHDNHLILDSLQNEITITKLEAPTTFNLSLDGILNITNQPSASMLDQVTPYVLTINGEIAKILDKVSTTYQITAKYNANTERVKDAYYLDSELSVFNITRLDAPEKPQLNETKVSWVAQEYENIQYKVNFIQNISTRTLTLSENQIDIFDERLTQINLSEDFSVSVSYEFSSVNIDLTKNKDYKFTSPISEEAVVHKIKSDVKMYIEESNAGIMAKWDNSTDVEEVNYQLSIDDFPIYEGKLNSFDITEQVVLEKVYTLKLKITKQGYLDSEYVAIRIERLINSDTIEIDEEENITLNTSYNDSQLEKVKITKDGEEITNLQGITGKFEINVQLIAKTLTEGNYYYLNSKINTYKFARISTFSEPRITENSVRWDKIDGINNFILKFTANENSRTLNISNRNALAGSSSEIQSMFKDLETNDMNISVKASVGTFTANKNQEYTLSSMYSEPARIVQLKTIEESVIKVESNTDDAYQEQVKISWDYNFEDIKIKQIDLDIYHNGMLISQEYMTGNATSLVVDNMTEPGEYYVQLRVLGKDFCLDSDYSTSYTVTRLSAPTDLSMDENCVFTWTGINNCEGYNVSYYVNENIHGELNNVTATTWDVSEAIYSENFGGTITFNVVAVGDQGKNSYKTLSSPLSQDYVVTKVFSGSIRLSTDKFTVGAETEDEFDSQSKYLIQISTDGRIVEDLKLNYGDTYTFGDFVYQDTKEKVDTTLEKDFIVTVQRIIEDDKFIKSDITTREFVKLKQVADLGFTRKADGYDSKIWIQGKVDHFATRYELSVGGLSSTEFTDNGLIFEMPLVNEIYNSIPEGDVEFKIVKKGLIKDTGISYIDSSPTIIKATKLATPKNFRTQSGVLTWNMVDKASDYIIKVNNTKVLNGYIVDGEHTLFETFKDDYGSLTLNIKAIGNVGVELKSSDILLDSSYITGLDEEGQIVLKDYFCQKLKIPGNFRGVNGYLGFEESTIDTSAKYEVIVDGNHYSLSKVGSYDGNTYGLYYSQSLYDSLQDNTKYKARIRAISNKEGILYSEISNSINIKILPNTIRGTVDFELKQISEDPVKYDYSISQIKWAEAQNATNGYKVRINSDGRQVEFETEFTNFTLNNGEYEVSSHSNYAKVIIKGDSFLDDDGCYKLDSSPSEAVYFYKLKTPKIGVTNGKLTWEAVQNATGYLVYLDGYLYSEEPIKDTSCFVNFSDLLNNRVYSSYEVMAVSEDARYIPSTKALYLDQEGYAKAVTKLHAPDSFKLEDGVLRWDITDGAVQDYLIGRLIESPFTFDINMLEQGKPTQPEEGEEGEEDEEDDGFSSIIQQNGMHIDLKFVNNDTLTEKVLQINPLVFCKMSEKSQQDTQESALRAGAGWPTLNYSYEESGWDPDCGSYTYYLRQPGDSDKYLESNYGSAQDIYIPYAPRIKVSYTSGSYILNWNSISIPVHYNVPEVTYQVIIEDNSRARTLLIETKELSTNLTEHIEAGELTSIHTKIFVRVKGNSRNVLNGKNSNSINLKVLNHVSAYIQNGEVAWETQESASMYIITYSEANNLSSKQTLEKTECLWDCAELNSDVEYYDITIKAVGLTVDTYDHATLTGPTTNVGKLNKLKDPNVFIKDGVFAWNNVDNCLNYNVYVNHTSEEEPAIIRVSNLENEEGNVIYETIYYQENILYQFRSVGDLDIKLDENAFAYVNSNIASDKYGTVLDSVTTILATQGQLTWDTVTNNELYINYYRLTFNEINESGAIINSSQIIRGGSFRENSDDLYCIYNGVDLAHGKYQVIVQPYYPTEREEGKYIYMNTQAYYLMGISNQTYTFEKYNNVQGIDAEGNVFVDNIALKDGKFSWEYSGDKELNNFEYQLLFESSKGNKITVNTQQQDYIDYINENLIPNETYELKVRVVPKENVNGFINSDYVGFKNTTNYDSPTIFQLNAVQEKDIRLLKNDETGDVFINWENYQIASGTTDLSTALKVEYILEYWTTEESGETTDKVKVRVREKEFNTVNMSFNITEGHTLYYTLQVIPLGSYSCIPSCVSEVRDIKKPDSVDKVTFDAEQQVFAWEASTTTTDHCFKIRDEILQTNSQGELMLDSSNKPIVLRSYIYTTENNTTTTYVPMEQGWHRISVAVVIRTSGADGGLDSEYKYYYSGPVSEGVDDSTTGTPVKIDLFQVTSTNFETYAGMGTVENPYIVTNTTQFDNIKYRLEKPTYQNTYILKINETNQRVNLEQENYNYHFKQSKDISGVQPFGTGKTVQFKGSYDGDNYKLQWICDLSKVPTYQLKFISLFSELATTAVVKNVQVVADVSNISGFNGGTISMVAHKNAGTISNVVVGAQNSNLTINKVGTYWNGVCNTNTGTISNVVNLYTVVLTSNNQMGYSGICSSNTETGIVSCCANYGNISITAGAMISGGIVSTNKGIVERCVLKNSTTSISADPLNSITAYFGGIVGKNELVGTVEYCYVDTIEFNVERSKNEARDVFFVAGLVGWSKTDTINRCYVNIEQITTSQSVEIGNLFSFAYTDTVNILEETFCYANNVGTPVNDTSFEVTIYSRVPNGTLMNEPEKQYYTNNNEIMPVLVWENEFKAAWKGVI